MTSWLCYSITEDSMELWKHYMAPPIRFRVHDAPSMARSSSQTRHPCSATSPSTLQYNCTVQDPAILRIPQLPIREELEEPPTIEAWGSYNTPQDPWTPLPQELLDAVIIILYKKKGEKSDCSNYQGITLWSLTGKVLARILLNRLVTSIAKKDLPESQRGFRANRSTTDMVFFFR